MKRRDKLLGIEAGYFLSLLVLYTIAHGGLLLILNAIYLEDWMLYGVGNAVIVDLFRQSGSVFSQAGYLHVAMLAAGPWLYKVLTFVLMFSAGVVLWKILERHPRMSVDVRYAIVLLFLLLPFNGARVALINFPAIVSCFLFFLAWYFLGRNRLLALALFFLSFNVSSLLVFYALPMAEWYLRPGNGSRPTLWRWAVRRMDFLLMPFLYWLVKMTYFKTVFAGYQDFRLEGLIKGPLLMAAEVPHLEIGVVLLLALALLSAIFVKKPELTAAKRPGGLLVAGPVALICAVLPYWVVGAVPTFHGWSSRHQLLMPLGAALIAVAVLHWLSAGTRHAAFVLLIAVSLAVNVQAYAGFHQDWSKRQELIAHLSQSSQIRDAGVIVFDDRTVSVRKMPYQGFEWNGMMKLAYGDETRIGLRPEEIGAYLEGQYDRFFLEQYRCGNHVRKPDPKAAFVEIAHAPKPRGIRGRLMAIVRGEPRFQLVVREGRLQTR